MKDFIRHQRGRMFESDFFEFFSKVHPAAPFVLWLPIAAFVIFWSLSTEVTRPVLMAAFLPLGFVTWQLMEYFIHKKVFHWLGNGPITRRFHDIVHGFHHKYPDDDTRLVMPLAVSIFLGTSIAGALWLLGRPDMTVPFWLGILLGYLWYDFLHWSTHFRKPLTAWGRKLRDHHMAHHFAADGWNHHFGISHMWIDRLMGTLMSRGGSESK